MYKLQTQWEVIFLEHCVEIFSQRVGQIQVGYLINSDWNVSSMEEENICRLKNCERAIKERKEAAHLEGHSQHAIEDGSHQDQIEGSQSHKNIDKL